MSAAPNDPPKLAVPPVAAPPVEEPLEIVPDEPEAFEVAASPAAAPSKAASWYVGRGGQRQGPFELSQLQRQMQTGELTPSDLLWREGMASWTAARDVPEVHAASAPLVASPPAPSPAHVSPTAPAPVHAAAHPQPPVHAPAAAPSPAAAPTAAPYQPAPKPSELLAPLDRFFARPAFYRLAGYIAGGLGVLAILASLILWYWGRTWFGGAATLIAIFFVCQAAAAILDALQGGKGRPGNRSGGRS